MCHWNGSAGTVACKHVEVYTQLLESQSEGGAAREFKYFPKASADELIRVYALYIYLFSVTYVTKH